MSGIGRTRSITLAGLRGEVVHVEADIAQSLPGFTLLGLPDQALQESCLLYTSPSPRDVEESRMPSSA